MGDDLSTSQQIMQQISDIMSGLSDTVKNIGQTLDVFPEKADQSSAGFEKLTNSAKQTDATIRTVSNSFTDYINKLSGAFGQIKKMTEENSGQVTGLTKVLVDMGAIGISSLTPVSAAFGSMGESAKNSGNIIDKQYSGLIDKMGKTATAVLAHAEANKKAEIGLVGLYAKSGELNAEFDRTQSGIQSLSNLTNQFANQIEATGIATGTTSGETSSYAKMLLTIPGAYNSVIVNSPVGSISTLRAAMTVTKGTTQDFTDVFNVMSQQFKNFGQVGEKPLELMSQMYSVSQSLGLPFENINTIIKKTSDQFRFFGDNTNAALKILSGFAPALKDSGVGPAGIQEIVGHLTDAVDSLDIAQKSFISSQTGGAGGLQGGYQIDLLMQQGKMDEVFSKMQESLKKQFGKIVSLEDAAKSPEAAGQLTKQVAFLRQGPLGKMASSDQEAYKILDAFKAGAKPAVSSPTENRDAFGTALNQGSALQERHNNLLTIASNELDRFASAVGDVDAKLVRDLVGTGNDGKGSMMNETIIKTMDVSKNAESTDQKNTLGGEEVMLQTVGKGLDLVGSAGKNLINGAQNVLSNVLEKSGVSADESKDVSKLIQNQFNPQEPQKEVPKQLVPANNNTTTAPFFRPTNQPQQLTPINDLHRMVNQTNPNIEANAARNNLINMDREKTVNASYKTNGVSKDDKLTIMLKTDDLKEAKVIAIVHGEINKLERKNNNLIHAGFSGE